MFALIYIVLGILFLLEKINDHDKNLTSFILLNFITCIFSFFVIKMHKELEISF